MKKNKSERAKVAAAIPAPFAETQEAQGASPAIKTVLISDETLKQGRPIDPSSNRQKRIAEFEAKKIELGVDKLKQGRPADPTSARAIRTAAMQARIEAGETIHRGRPMDPNSANQLKKAEAANKQPRMKLTTGQIVFVNAEPLKGMLGLKVVKVKGGEVTLRNGEETTGYVVPKALISLEQISA